jgi:streptomycin 6-kinase
VAWTMARVLQNSLWDIEDGKHTLDPVQITIAHALQNRASLALGPRESRVRTR